MAIVRIDKEIFRRVQSVNSLAKGLADFIYCCQRDLHPPRIYKRSGMSADGSIACQPYYDLNLHHHHLHRDGDPLLVTQHIGEIIQSVALTTHQEYLHRDTLLWLQTHAEAICWDKHHELETKIRNYRPAE